MITNKTKILELLDKIIANSLEVQKEILAIEEKLDQLRLSLHDIETNIHHPLNLK